MKYREMEGNLITLAKQGKFDVIAHGCNCFCTMKSGLAPQMARAFGCDKYHLEKENFRGDINKLGNVETGYYCLRRSTGEIVDNPARLEDSEKHTLAVVNCYTQYSFNVAEKPLDYEALILCLKKMNKLFAGKHIGLPQIGCHLAGGDWEVVKILIRSHLKDCDVTVVIYDNT